MNYAKRHRAGLRVGTAITEGTVDGEQPDQQITTNAMVAASANLLLQVRCAADNGTFGSGFKQRFPPANDTHPPAVVAA